jgi:hypothetical protein
MEDSPWRWFPFPLCQSGKTETIPAPNRDKVRGAGDFPDFLSYTAEQRIQERPPVGPAKGP